MIVEQDSRILPTAIVEDYNVMIDGKKFLDQRIKNDIKTNENIRKIKTGQGNDQITSCLRYYNHSKKHYKMIAMDLSKQQALDADPKSIQQISFTGNLSIYLNNISKKINIFHF